tara:strand:- start:346 stop:639 length:294 start_codon:yes stop_codon:yes gene_type:complete
MNIHIINLEYLVNEDAIAKIIPLHRDFLDTGYANGMFLASGPNSTKTAGVILAIGKIADIQICLQDDPFHIHEIAEYSFSTFDAVKTCQALSEILNS